VSQGFLSAQDDDDAPEFGTWLASLVGLPYYALSFVSDLVVSLTALITRTLATLGEGAVSVLSDCVVSEGGIAATGRASSA
jgi:hypothetical protein